ncbi:MAG TPA: helix-turn-helix domain-containing protein [Acidimicrobiales bacterium]|nr:helix-turn-helix domain-containing protein [Acidimicrobiales bacterium]
MVSSNEINGEGSWSQAAEEQLAGLLPQPLLREFQELGLSPYAARVLLALLRLGSANSADLARVSGVPRTSTYQVLEELNAKRLAARVPGDGPAVWTTPGSAEVLERLDAAEEDRLRQHRARTARLRAELAKTFPEGPTAALPYVNLVHGTAQVKTLYERLLAQAQEEVLVFNRPPYTWSPGQPNPVVLETLARGVRTRVLYQAAQLEDSAGEAFRQEMDAYHDAGVQGRVVEDLPVKLAVFDRRESLLVIPDPVLPEVGFPTTLLVEHAGFASIQAAAFEHVWSQARPYPTTTPGPKGVDTRSLGRRASVRAEDVTR